MNLNSKNTIFTYKTNKVKYNRNIIIGKKTIGDGFPPYIIAEMACAHNGSYDQAKELIRISKESGADACQLQFFIPESTVTPNHEVFQVLKNIEFSQKQWESLFNYGKDIGLEMFVCTYDIPSVLFAINLGVDGIKLNSSDLSNPDILKAVAKSGIPFTLGTGASSFEEISKGLIYASENGANNIVLMHGVQNFPTQNKDLNISRIELLKDVFKNIPVGYADHTNGDDEFGRVIDLIALGFGASVFEKHITLSRKDKGIDYQAALEPHELKDYVSKIRKGHEAIGSQGLKPLTKSDLKYRKFQKKSIVANCDLKEGEIITRDKVEFLRNSEPGLAPIDFNLIEKKVLRFNKKKYANIIQNDVK